MSELRHQVVAANGIRIHVAEQGEGPLVLLVHGFPESWYSWRHQLPALADAGYRAAAIDVRGYGRSSCPERVDQYRMLLHVADNLGVVEALGEARAVVVGHDWGAPIAWNSALLRPDVFVALATLSVPYSPRGSVSPKQAYRAMAGDQEFYVEYFQEPGRAEAELEEDVRSWLHGFYASASAGAPTGKGLELAIKPYGAKLRDRFAFPDEPLAWLTEADLDYYVAEFERTGFTGGLNRYRNTQRDWEDFAAFADRPVTVPALFIGGDSDGATVWGAEAITRFDTNLPASRGSHLLEACGHWTQQEQPEQVNRLLIEFLDSLARA